ncbi:hypothetical protein ASG01_08095 [Chryseobacterium sp. Leaf180]|uniref:hypothetical protein n=1 Tax=Chryseobacterium sp. Leaf180 TaxID=1736289 RepID=UPI0006F29859|nr:hypothetical protein [Chryseobacterium sp. Leaf180]KQR93814.1 hypothetical protein ASG01_08095 [Chryseobacterium sp. Leaf180]
MTNEILIFNTPNSGEILQKINHYEFERQWKNNLKKNNKNLYWGVTFIAFGIITVLLKNYTFSGFFFGFSLASVSSYFNYLSQYKKIKKTFYDKLDQEISDLKTNSNDVIWEFTPTHFGFKNYKSEYKFIWEEITYCILDDQYLYITASSFMNFILDKVNIDEENLKKTIYYLESKSLLKEI